MPRADRPAHAQPIDRILSDLDVSLEEGLSSRQVKERRREHGPNRLRETKGRSVWSILFDQVKSVVMLLLGAAGVLAFAFGHLPEGVAITAVLVVNGLIGFFSEWRASRSMEALRKMGRRQTRVRREGSEDSVSVDQLVPGDIVIFDAGDLVPADLRVTEANALRVNEAALTGESMTVSKSPEPVAEDAPLAERTSMLFKGTTVVEGSGEGIAVATGMATELGRVTELAEAEEKQATPLQRRLDRLGHRLAWITLGLAALIAGAGLLSGQPTWLMIETAIALGVAAIPEGLPIVATIALARGMWLMARRQVLINRLPAVETLGATRVIFTDKTGTLTENRMTVRRLLTDGGDYELEVDPSTEKLHYKNGRDADAEAGEPPLLRQALTVGVLCNNASLPEGEDDEAKGDPTEIALLEAGRALGIDREELLDKWPEAREVAFDPDVMMMATFHERDGEYFVAVKGAPSAIVNVCDRVAQGESEDRPLEEGERESWLETVDELAADGLRVLAMAERRVESDQAEPYRQLRLLGFIGLLDPWRPEVRDSIAACQNAGIRVVMSTGDQPQTARAIGEQVGLSDDGQLAVMEGSELRDPEELSDERRRRILDTAIFARVSPKQKLQLIRTYQDAGEIVAMTGDGVNDAPALKTADIGVAMGKRGTDAARQAADMVLKDDAFSSIVAAVEEGRIIFSNIRKSTLFMLCTNVAEVIAVAIASAVRAPLPLLPLQILYLNVITDVFPALALGVGKGDSNVMNRPPRSSSESVLTRSHWLRIGGWALLIAACVLAALAAAHLWLDLEGDAAITVSFLTLGTAKVWYVFNLRDPGSSFWRNDVVRNPWIWVATALCLLLLAAALFAPGLSDVLRTRWPGAQGIGLLLVAGAIPFLVGQTIRFVQRIKAGRS
ncbi:MAG: cation-transporting P-type ATPase [Gemmatimonadetes bacterium]|uniref:Cation-transporting P-type ATPase n=1 Tax=Candidatus Kutchimonas denitrificans TaxID=3056748 RepID=A0AAE4ZD64_9BACT|nr:cation-transporting P-type ATPase [Gemmatimonadota bacterium]NIR76721.1 cation-transporting P-type ATPase [Candidatus Kutchimonas denitrificans]NIS01208.1 cation-transporting P-type ATPase [Gemmatimonadota bacterium]NIT68247.1 cation-transporting P-type ATPase [Gemmatimonadota bacterium]NIW75465.1 HAD-IC family P-type ATPase [Gemmatimonadota bacterium]